MSNKDYYGSGGDGRYGQPPNTYYTNGPSSIGVPPQAYGAPPPVNDNRPEMAYAPQTGQGFYQNSSYAPYYSPPQPYYNQQAPLYATEGPGVSRRPAGGMGGGERGFLGALLATLCCCCLADDAAALVAGPAMYGPPVDPSCCICC